NAVYELYKLCASTEEVAEMAAKLRAGGYGYGHAKKDLQFAVERLFGPFRERRAELERHPDELEDILRDGAKRAQAAAAPVMEKVRTAVGIL
ncbi:MAG: tryptophan--tRNA ligase, partial [Kiritimatiellae bacterium]|nr:tryptophan--tRNA ligase [Kiritimatiellia bacterium]